MPCCSGCMMLCIGGTLHRRAPWRSGVATVHLSCLSPEPHTLSHQTLLCQHTHTTLSSPQLCNRQLHLSLEEDNCNASTCLAPLAGHLQCLRCVTCATVSQSQEALPAWYRARTCQLQACQVTEVAEGRVFEGRGRMVLLWQWPAGTSLRHRPWKVMLRSPAYTAAEQRAAEKASGLVMIQPACTALCRAASQVPCSPAWCWAHRGDIIFGTGFGTG
jgi:hypothetical protein